MISNKIHADLAIAEHEASEEHDYWVMVAQERAIEAFTRSRQYDEETWCWDIFRGQEKYSLTRVARMDRIWAQLNET